MLGPRHLPRHQVPGEFASLGPDLTSEERGLHQLSAPRVLAGVERSEDAGQKVLAGDVVGDGGPDRTGIAARPACRTDDPSSGLPAQVSPLTLCVGPFWTERRPHGIDDPRVPSRPLGITDAPTVHGAGLEVGDDDVGMLDQTQEDVAPTGHAEVDGGAALAPVVSVEPRRAAVLPADRQPAALIAEPRQFDLDHLGSPLEHGLGGLGSLDEQPSLQHAHPVERSHQIGDDRGRGIETGFMVSPRLVSDRSRVKRARPRNRARRLRPPLRADR